MRKAIGNKLLRSHFCNFCSTDYSGHAIHKSSVGSACRCSYPNCGCKGVFLPVNNHYCACWASLHMQISKNEQVAQEVSDDREFSNCPSLLFKLLLLIALMSNLSLFRLISAYLKNAKISISACQRCAIQWIEKKKTNRSHKMQ